MVLLFVVCCLLVWFCCLFGACRFVESRWFCDFGCGGLLVVVHFSVSVGVLDWYTDLDFGALLVFWFVCCGCCRGLRIGWAVCLVVVC